MRRIVFRGHPSTSGSTSRAVARSRDSHACRPRDSTPVAVRSSAAGEDGAEQSHAAGAAPIPCWASTPSEKACAAAVTRCIRSVSSERASACIPIQPAADASGGPARYGRAPAARFVRSPADPTAKGRRDLVVIDAVHGRNRRGPSSTVRRPRTITH